VVQAYRVAIVDPFERHTGNVGPQDLLRYVGHKSSEHTEPLFRVFVMQTMTVTLAL